PQVEGAGHLLRDAVLNGEDVRDVLIERLGPGPRRAGDRNELDGDPDPGAPALDLALEDRVDPQVEPGLSRIAVRVLQERAHGPDNHATGAAQARDEGVGQARAVVDVVLSAAQG